MARIGAGAALIAAAAVGVAAAQTLPQLRVTALGMHADRTAAAVGTPFHVTVHVHVREQRSRLDELVLPTISNALDLGDTQRRVASASGTDFYETLTVRGVAPGPAEFSPAYIDAIDPTSGKALRYSSDAVSVTITPASPLAALSAGGSPALRLLAAAFAGAAALLVVGGLAARRLRRRALAAVEARAADRPSERAGGDPLRDAIALVRARGDDGAMDTLRVVLYARAGLGTGATLSDALREIGGREPQLARALEATERARFAPLPERPAATRELLRLLYDYAGAESPA